MANPWFRLYSEIINDPKVKLIDRQYRWDYVALLCAKNLGELDKDYSDDLRREILETLLQRYGNDFDETIETLLRVELIDENWQPRGWAARQFKTDSSTERVRKYREKKKKKKVKRKGNVSVTAQDTEQIQNRTDTEGGERPPKNVSPNKRARRTKSPPVDFVIHDGLKTWATKNAITIDLDEQTNRFLDHTFPSAYADWDGAWRNWIRRAQDWSGSNGGGKPRPGDGKKRIYEREAPEGL